MLSEASIRVVVVSGDAYTALDFPLIVEAKHFSLVLGVQGAAIPVPELHCIPSKNA
jgi:hypothetical protein